MVSREISELVEQLEAGRLSRRQFVSRASALGLSFGAMGALLSACGGNDEAQGPAGSGEKVGGAVKVYKGPFAANEAELQKRAIAGFAKKVPDVKVKFEQFDWTTVEAQVTASFARGAHDVVYMPENIYAKFASADGPVEDLSKYVEEPSWATERASIGENFWSVANPTGDFLGAVPYVTQPNSMFFVNTTMLEKAGVGEDWNSSYEAVGEAAAKMTGNGNYGMAIRTNGLVNFGWFDWLGYIRRAGGDFLDPEWKSCALNKPEVAQSLDWLAGLFKREVVVPYGRYTWPALRDLFVAGKIGITHDEATLDNILRTEKPRFEWAVASFPPPSGIWKNDKLLSISGVFTISKKSKNKAAAWEVIKYWSSLDAITPYLGETKILSVRSDATDIWTDSPVLREVQNDFIPNEQGPQLHPKVNEFVNIVQPLVDSAYRGKLNGAQVTEQACTQIEKAL